MKTLLLMRHAKSDWKQPGRVDHDRPLNARGRNAAPAMGRHLQAEGIQVDVILASSAERVRETVELLQTEWVEAAEVLSCPTLYLASPQVILREIQTLDDAWHSAMVVAHNPGLVSLLCYLSAQQLEMPTAAIAVLDVSTDSWHKSLGPKDCRLRAYWKPRAL